MKSIYKYASALVLGGMLSTMMVNTASAQRGFHGGGGGGGGGGVSSFHGGGGGFGFHANNGLSFRGNSGGSHAALSYRSGTGYFGGAGYHGGAFYRPGFGYYGYPHLGFYLGGLPFGYYPFYWGSDLYYYSGGIFYSPYEGGYQVTTPPIGAGVPSLPENAQAIKIDGAQYYEVDGVYYKESKDDKGKKIYVVAGRDGVLNTADSATDPNASATPAAPQIGDIVNELPDGCHRVSLNGKRYYVSPNDIYYEKVTDPNGNVAFKIVSLPAPDDKDDRGI